MGGGRAGVSEFFYTMNLNLKYIYFFFLGGGRGLELVNYF